MDYPPNYTIKKYKPKSLTAKELKFCEAILAGCSNREALRLAGYTEKYTNLIQSKRVRNYLDKHDKRNVVVPVTYESKMEKLGTVIEAAIPEDLKNREKIDHNLIGKGLQAIAEANKMQGHYAPTQTQNMNVNVDVEQQQASELFKKLLKENKKDY